MGVAISYNATINQDSGLTTAEAQYAICTGTYGNKKWSASEKEAACIRYEELTGSTVHREKAADTPLWLFGGGVLIVLLGVVLGSVLFRKRLRK